MFEGDMSICLACLPSTTLLLESCRWQRCRTNDGIVVIPASLLRRMQRYYPRLQWTRRLFVPLAVRSIRLVNVSVASQLQNNQELRTTDKQSKSTTPIRPIRPRRCLGEPHEERIELLFCKTLACIFDGKK